VCKVGIVNPCDMSGMYIVQRLHRKTFKSWGLSHTDLTFEALSNTRSVVSLFFNKLHICDFVHVVTSVNYLVRGCIEAQAPGKLTGRENNFACLL